MNEHSFYSSERRREQHGESISLGAYTAKTFLWMFAGLTVTFLTAVLGAYSGLLVRALTVFPYLPMLLLIVELVVVLSLVTRLQRLTIGAARGLFFAYAVLNGVVFSTYFLIFSMGTLILIFGMTALYFGALALYGFITKTDLSRIRPILVGGLILLLVFGLLSLFLNLSSAETIFCIIGIAVFLGFTAYDTQKIKSFHTAYAHDPEMSRKASVVAALQLYLDFVNLFLYLLRIFSRRRE